jgi:hypothetical protein
MYSGLMTGPSIRLIKHVGQAIPAYRPAMTILISYRNTELILVQGFIRV